ncbi:hypothetical protein CJ030_MR1G002135 [Morella rubra]|uniref:Uncharacterized protein n=1 Tax=Morella rubra TaxID=262757 RepID=A0A6A1WV44_9ROSI|nr:hypothetical protein CJ030_MR1G002135 [Morella rubra]
MSCKYLLLVLFGVVLLTTSSLADDGKKPQSPKHKPPQKYKPPTSLDESPEGDNPFDKPPSPKGKGEKLLEAA